MNLLINSLVGIVGIVIGWIFQRGITFLSKPNIRIILGEDAFMNKGLENEKKFVHINVYNDKRNKFFRFLLDNQSANNARAWVSFIEPITKSEFFKINGRWTTTKEPVNYETNKADISLALIPPRESIPAGENSVIVIAIKSNNSSSAFAFNNESYLYDNWEKPDHELSENIYIVEVKVTSEGYEWKKRFILHNPGKTTSRFNLN